MSTVEDHVKRTDEKKEVEEKREEEKAVVEEKPVVSGESKTEGELKTEEELKGEGESSPVKFMRKKKEKKEKKESGPPPPPPRALDDPRRWKMVVGEVKRVWEHECSEKLWCEEIDIGEEKVRMIGSGLRANISKEDFEGSKVIVLANLKEKKLGGFPSHGMVVCANINDHEKVELLLPPPEAQVGDLVTFEGLEHADPDPTLTSKKNGDTITAVMNTLHTDDQCCACAGTHRFLVRGKYVKANSLANAQIS